MPFLCTNELTSACYAPQFGPGENLITKEFRIKPIWYYYYGLGGKLELDENKRKRRKYLSVDVSDSSPPVTFLKRRVAAYPFESAAITKD